MRAVIALLPSEAVSRRGEPAVTPGVRAVRAIASPSIAALVRMREIRSALLAKKDKPFQSSGIGAGTKKARSVVALSRVPR